MSVAALVAEWINKAEDDYDTACRIMRWRKKPQPDAVCYHCQQCAEKYLKAFLVLHSVDFPRIHHLPRLNELCSNIEGSFVLIGDLLEQLNPIATEIRYPGFSAQISDARYALIAVKRVREFMRNQLKTKGVV